MELEPRNMFWGVAVKPGKRYETEVQEAFRITKACLVPSTADGKVSTLFIENDKSEEFILANLSLKNFNETLDISFNEGEKICFKVSGPGTIHLTGNLLECGDNDSDYDEGESEDDVANELKNLNWTKQQIKQLKGSDWERESEFEDADDDSDDKDDEEEEDSEDSEVSSEEEIPDLIQILGTKSEESISKQPNLSNGVTNKQTAEKTENKTSVKEISEAKPKKVVKNGIIIEDLVEGSGVACQKGNGVGMYYTGRLKTSKKAFDSCQSGKPFRFKLGAGTVIKGWDIGLQGIKVGGKRRLTIPSAMGYGKRGAPPDIPPNSTLVFDVECKFIYGGNQY
eukprot:TRINITY_DN4830_c0_g1_i3.p1 TRINITY_DN4830_c0_g1~~TRINITY_DN4830_c0_g1_i3.p1  ORF type:complete len:339 (-),score=121.85 TRINITY_DN4830_c0_g1_i3:55-1071(-)